MNLHKKCLKCHEFFSAKPLEFKFFCEKKECQKYFNELHFYSIKRARHLPAYYFDLYDLDRINYSPKNKKYISYERVCRICGNPLLKKDGKYSYRKRYCNKHYGNGLWEKYNWGFVSKNYAINIRDKNKELIKIKFNEIIQNEYKLYREIPNWVKKTTNLTICEVCNQLCQVYSQTFLYNRLKIKTINIHHKIPIHTLKNDNLHLIWDENNLIALCEDCHHKQDHQLKRKVDPFLNFKKITEFLT